MRFEDYAINIAPISEEEGGGYLVRWTIRAAHSQDLTYAAYQASGERGSQPESTGRDSARPRTGAEIEGKAYEPQKRRRPINC